MSEALRRSLARLPLVVVALVWLGGSAYAQNPQDTCQEALPIGEGLYAFDSTGSTSNPFCQTFGGPFAFDAVYFCYTPTATGTATIEIDSFDGFPKMSIYPTCVCPPGLSSCFEIYGPFPLSVVAGTSYMLTIGNYFSGDEGPGTIEITLVPTVTCDPVTGLSCSAVGDDVELTWVDGGLYDEVEILRDGLFVGSVAAGAQSFADTDAPAGTHAYAVHGVCGALQAAPATCDITLPPLQRGDCNTDGAIDIADAISILSRLFSGGATGSCADACDANDDGAIDVADAISGLSALFGATAPLPPPYPACGADPTADGLGCIATPCGP